MSADLNELLKSLQRDYLAELPAKIARIEAVLSPPSGADPSALTDLRVAFHKLKGTGQTYGLPEVSELSACAEELCERALEQATEHAELPVAAALEACRLAAALLRAIAEVRAAGTAFTLSTDARWVQMRRLLARAQNTSRDAAAAPALRRVA